MRDGHAVSLIEVHQDFSRSLADGSLQCRAGHPKASRPRYRLEQLATGFRRITPDFDSVWSVGRFGSASTAAFANRVPDVGAIADEVDALAVLHDTRSYCGFQPRPMPFDIRLLAMKS